MRPTTKFETSIETRFRTLERQAKFYKAVAICFGAFMIIPYLLGAAGDESRTSGLLARVDALDNKVRGLATYNNMPLHHWVAKSAELTEYLTLRADPKALESTIPLLVNGSITSYQGDDYENQLVLKAEGTPSIEAVSKLRNSRLQINFFTDGKNKEYIGLKKLIADKVEGTKMFLGSDKTQGELTRGKGDVVVLKP